MIEPLVHRPWKVLKSENILKIGPWLSVRQEEVELPNGHRIPTWFVLEYPNWINVIAETKDGQLVMNDQYRHGLGVTAYELVAGVIDPGESPLEAAKRELNEETGFGGGEWEEYMILCPNTSCQDNLSITFLARGVEKTSEPHEEESEDIRVHVMSKDDVKQLLEKGEIIQALHAAPLWKYFAK
ncbi:MAG: NUDIX hydrolase [Paludibacteraceae bacterium]|nr:NUDIX hydrolase [Paludibacteraceae bacterium]